MQLENQRKLTDFNLTVASTLPTTNNSNVATASFNLVQPFAISEQFAVQVTIDPLANFGTTGALTVVIQDSADNVNFANIPELGSTIVNVNTNVVTVDQFRLPPTARQYVRGLAAITAINGNVSVNNLTLQLTF